MLEDFWVKGKGSESCKLFSEQVTIHNH